MLSHCKFRQKWVSCANTSFLSISPIKVQRPLLVLCSYSLTVFIHYCFRLWVHLKSQWPVYTQTNESKQQALKRHVALLTQQKHILLQDWEQNGDLCVFCCTRNALFFLRRHEPRTFGWVRGLLDHIPYISPISCFLLNKKRKSTMPCPALT